MKRIVFLISHVGSDSDKLLQILNENSRVQIENTEGYYNHPSDLNHFGFQSHKMDGTAAIYGDHLLHNVNFSCEALHSIGKFIYLIREAKPSLNENSVHPRKSVENYYRFRLRRIYEMASKTPGAVFLTWDEVRTGEGFLLIEDYLGLKEPLVAREDLFPKSIKDRFSFDVVERCQDVYEKYLYRLRNLKLNCLSP
jgi:hypothetical protein